MQGALRKARLIAALLIECFKVIILGKLGTKCLFVYSLLIVSYVQGGLQKGKDLPFKAISLGKSY